MAREKVLCGKEEIIRVAVSIVDSEGIEALTTKSLSEELRVSRMTIYNYVDNLNEIKKMVLTGGFDRMYAYIYQALREEDPDDKISLCRTLARSVFRFSMKNKNIFAYMFYEGRSLFSEDAEIRPFYTFFTKFTKRAQSAQEYSENRVAYEMLDIMVFSIAHQCAAGINVITESEFNEKLEFFLKKCLN